MKEEWTYKDYANCFFDILDSNEVIQTEGKTEQLVFTDNEKWKQCYSPNDKARSQLPIFWFVSDIGNLIAIETRGKNKGKKAHLLKKWEQDGYYSYHFSYKVDDETTICKSIKLHNLVGIVFGSYRYGKAHDLLEEQGIFAIGVKNKQKLAVNGHHEESKENNSPKALEFVTTKVHKDIIDALPSMEEPGLKYIKDFSTITSEEEPNKISILLVGQTIDKESHKIIDDNGFRAIYGTDKITLSANAVEQLKNIKNDILDRWLVYKAIDSLVNTYDADYFVDPKYFTTNNDKYFKCEKISDELHITDIDNMLELVDKHLIGCFLNEDNTASCVVQTSE